MKKPPVTAKQIAMVRYRLHTQFPAAFADFKKPKQPLKIGIRESVCAREATRGITPRMIDAAIRDYTSGKRYLQAMIPGAPRIDLDGNPSGAVTEAAAIEAANRLTKLQRKEAHT